jgi:enoyl-CoA hydratase
MPFPATATGSESRMIDLKIKSGIAVLTLRHGKASALDIELCEALKTQFEALRDADVRAIVLTGHGNIFSAGVDFLRLSAGGGDYARKFLPALDRMFDAVFFHPKPVVAAINGHAIAGGCVLACCADRRIMAPGKGRIGVTELLVGVPFPPFAFEVMRFAVPRPHLSSLMFGGATYDAEVALQRGLIDDIADPEALLADAIAAAEKLAALSPPAFALTKTQLRQDAAERLAHAAETDKLATDIWAAPETLDYVRDYVALTLKKS